MGINYKAINTDISPIDAREGDYRFAQNIVTTETNLAVMNEQGNLLKHPERGIYLIGHIVVNKDTMVLFYTDNTAHKIGLFHNGNYTDIADPNGIYSDLGFNRENPIVGVYRYNFKGECIIAFTDNAEDIKYLNIGQLDSPQVTEANDINDLRFFPEANLASIRAEVSSGGRLRTGTVYITYRYIKEDGSTTDWLNLSNPKYIVSDVSSANNNYWGDITDSASDKVLKLTFTGVDTRYEKLEIAAIHYLNSVADPRIITQREINGSLLTYTYTGTELYTDESIDNIIVPTAKYPIVKTLTINRNRLYIGNLKDDAVDLEYQQYANNITLKWRVINQDLDDVARGNDAKYSSKTSQERSFQWGEVYAFYIVFILKDGRYSKAYHIPGRTAQSFDIATITIDGITDKNYKINDTPIYSGSGLEGQFGYWENEGESYPSEGNFPTGNVRHHRFPSSLWVGNNLYTGDSKYWVTKAPVAGIRVDNVHLPPEIQGYQIHYAKRSYNNSKVIGQGLIHSFASPPSDSSRIVPTGISGETRFSATEKHGDDRFVPIPEFAYCRSFDLLNDRPEMNNAIMQRDFRLSTSAQIFPEHNDGGVSYTVFAENCLIDYTDIANAETSQYYATNRLLRIEDYSYLPTGSNTGTVAAETIDNLQNTEILAFKANRLPAQFTSQFVASLGDRTTPYSIPNWETDYVTFFRDTENCYQDFTKQTLISTGTILNSSSPFTIILGGDAVISDHSYKTFGRHQSGIIYDADYVGRGLRTVHRHWIMGLANAGYRYQRTDLIDEGRFYPQSRLEQCFSQRDIDPFLTDFRIEQNQFGYNVDYNLLNQLKSTGYIIHGSGEELTQEYPYRVARSIVGTEEEQLPSWTKFLALDYYEMTDTKGVLVNLETYNQDLIIHHERALFKTRDKTRIVGSPNSATLGTGSIFELEPQELIPTPTGYAGTQHQFSCGVCKLGYYWVDAGMGKVFLLRDKLEEISNSGLRNFFRDYLKFIETRFYLYPIMDLMEWVNEELTETIEEGQRIYIYKKLYKIPSTSVLNAIKAGVPRSEKLIESEKYYHYIGDIISKLLLDGNTVHDICENQDYYIITLGNDYLTGTASVDVYIPYQVEVFGDNPYTTVGYTIGYDEKYNRLLLAKAHHGRTSPQVETCDGKTWVYPSYNKYYIELESIKGYYFNHPNNDIRYENGDIIFYNFELKEIAI